MKKIISLFLSIAMLLTFLSGLNFAANATDYQGVKTVASNLKTGDLFQMGNYPQSRVTDESTLNALSSISCTMKSYGYMQNSNASSHTYTEVRMTYADISYNGNLYRKVTISEYRPYWTKYSSSASNSKQDENGYTTGNTYYFKWEPIVWQVLDCEDDGVYVMSKSLLDSQAYNNFYECVTWETCSLRFWLNNDFYNRAFSANEKSKILTKTITNENNPNVGTSGGNDTTDKLWLLSYSDSINSKYGFSSDYSVYDTARRAQGTDYAKSQGLWVSTSSFYNGYPYWWLRTPGHSSYDACKVYNDGYVVSDYNNVFFTYDGVRPAFKLNLNSEIFKSDAAVGGATQSETNSKETIYHGKNSSIKVSDVLGDVSFKEQFNTTDTTIYNPRLAYLLAGLSRAAYNIDNIKNSYKSLGFDSIKTYKYDGSKFFAAHTIGKQTLSDGSTLVMITIRGSSNAKNWLSDFNFITTKGLSGNHVGFDTSANEVYTNLSNYLGGIKTSNVKYVITGHSYGAANANLLAMKLSNAGVPKANVYNYNFACPDVARGDSLFYWNPNGIHDNMFNIGYAKDYISVLPGITLNLSAVAQWGKYGRSFWFSKDWDMASEVNIDLSFKAHDILNYINYLSEFKALSGFKSWAQMNALRTKNSMKSIVHGFHCPVDVDVYDSNGKLIASVKNNEVVKYNSENGEVLVFVDGDEKYICVPTNKKYDFRLTGTDKGKMTYTSVKSDIATQEVEEQKTFDNVALTKGKEMETSSIANANVKDTKLYVVDEKQDIVAEVSTSGKETKKVSMNKVKISGIKSKTYNGKAFTQKTTVKYGKTTLEKGTNYTVSYKNNKNVGTATVTITGKGKYIGTIKKTFKINPRSTSVSKVTSPKSKQIEVIWKKQATQTTGYQIQYSTSSKFTSKTTKTVTVSKNKTTSKTISKLKSKKKYYIRVRTYKIVNGKKYYSSWSKSKTVTTKK